MRRVVLAALIAALGSLVVAPAAWAKSCADFDSQAEAQRYLRSHPEDPDHLDPDNNGIACENAPSPEDTEPVHHKDSSGQTIPLDRDSPTTRPPGGTTTTSGGREGTTTTGDDPSSTTSATNRDTTNETVSVNQPSEDAGVSTTGVIAVVVGIVLFAAAYVWFRRR